MKYKIITVSTCKVPYTIGNSIKGDRYDLVYEAEYWSWRKLKMVTDIKRAFKLPFTPCFKDSETGEFLSTKLDNLIDAYIAMHGTNDNTRSY